MALDRKDPYQAFNFSVTIDGITRAGFKGCTGLDSSTTATKYREGTDPTLASRQLPGLVTMTNITLTRGITDDHSLWDWREQVIKGKVQRKNVSIVMVANDGSTETPVHWNLLNAWVSEWRGAPLDALAREIAIESMTLVYDSLERG